MIAADRIADWIALGELKARYCRLLDAKDWPGWLELFTTDFELDTSGSGGPVPVRGREAAVAMVRRSIEDARTAHQVHSPEIAFTGDDAAEGVWAMQDRVVFADGSGLVGYGHYYERYVRTGGVWRIAASRLTRLHMDIQPAPPRPG